MKFKADKTKDKFYFIDENGVRLQTPNGFDVFVNKETQVQAVMDDLEKYPDGLGYDTCLQTYLFTYCEHKAKDDDQETRNIIIETASYQYLLGDPFLMFRQDCPAKQAIAGSYKDELPDILNDMNCGELSAFICITSCYDSLMLPCYIYNDIVKELNENQDNREELTNTFIDYMREYLFDNFEDDLDNDFDFSEDEENLDNEIEEYYEKVKAKRSESEERLEKSLEGLRIVINHFIFLSELDT